ncbi:MAG: sigma-70 family RNA polymerase sigma factor [Actinomycetota bacterium]|nr:sigma-70 family RNA polymerase sigma factor [Actinomycetota bacterium]
MLPRSRGADARVSTAPPLGTGARYDGLADRALVARVTEGDGGALEALYARYGRACFGLARRILGDEQFAQDVVQEVFLTVWRDASRFDASRGGFSTWLLSMTHHKAVDSVRREETLRKRRTTSAALETRETDAPRVEDQVWSLLRRERVREVLQTLPVVQREALTLSYFGGYTQREIAGLTSTPLGTVKTRMLAGMRRMKDSLDGLSNAAGGIEPSGPTPSTQSRDPRSAS